MTIEIRIATPQDASAACDVLRRSIAECCIADHQNDPVILNAWLGNKTPHIVANWFASPTNFSLLAIDAGQVVGVALLTRAGKLALCYLLPEVRRYGIGQTLLTRIEAQAKAWGIVALQLYSTAAGVAFYASLGYVQSDNVLSSYGVKTVFFWKQLDADSSPFDPQRKRFCKCNTNSIECSNDFPQQ